MEAHGIHLNAILGVLSAIRNMAWIYGSSSVRGEKNVSAGSRLDP
jgi:hypothetical protein